MFFYFPASNAMAPHTRMAGRARAVRPRKNTPTRPRSRYKINPRTKPRADPSIPKKNMEILKIIYSIIIVKMILNSMSAPPDFMFRGF